MTQEEIENIINKNSWKVAKVMAIVTIVGYIATIYGTNMQINSNQQIFEKQIKSDFEKIKFTNDYQEKMKLISKYASATSTIGDLFQLILKEQNHIDTSMLIDKVTQVNDSYANLIPYINSNKLNDFTLQNRELITMIIKIYGYVLINKDINTTQLTEYDTMTLKIIKELKSELLDSNNTNT